MSPLPAPLVIACHDAGAANLIAAWLPDLGTAALRLVLEGPARRSFAADLPSSGREGLAQAMQGAACLLSGTGWASDLEHAARAAARAAGVPSIAVLDHWVNYPQRFVRDGMQVLPDTLWVADPQALALAQAAFPGLPVVCQPNTWMARTVQRIGPLPLHGDLLVLMEPARSTWGRDRPGEFQALDHLVAQRHRLGLPPGTPWRLRPHPSEPAGKYDAWLAAHAHARLDSAGSLEAAMAPARWVAGCETAALPVALAAGRTAFCMLPPWAPPCRLPHGGLVHLNDAGASA